MNSHYDLTDEQFAAAFADCSLAPGLFNHEAHLRLAWIHLQRHGLNEAIDVICKQLAAYAQHLGALDKYHHTLSVAGVYIVGLFMQKKRTFSFTEMMKQYPELKTNFKGVIQAHYSIDIFNSVKAKKEYLEPDLQPFSNEHASFKQAH